MLEEVPSQSHGDRDAGNMLIQGDNLDALKALLPYYAGKVKCIYIDPPYNTRSAAIDHYDDNLEHSQWLALLYPRLELLRSLLAEDGSLWVSIDDNEGHYLKVIMDEVFGRANFVTTFIWQKVDSPNDNKVSITPDHEFVLCYEKRKDTAGFKKKGDASLLAAYAPCANMTCCTYPRYFKEQRGRYDSPPTTQGTHARRPAHDRSGRIARSPQGD